MAEFTVFWEMIGLLLMKEIIVQPDVILVMYSVVLRQGFARVMKVGLE